MSINREFNTRSSLRVALVLGAVLTALAVSPTASAGVRLGFSMNFNLPPGVHVSVGNYEPYYVGRVFYQPRNVWRPVYSFPVQTAYGVDYEPYVYDNGRVVCSDYIPGHEAGYGQFILEGRGHYNSQWNRGRSFYGRDGWRDRASYDRYRGWNQRQVYRGDGDRNRDGNWDRNGYRGDRNRDRGWNQRPSYPRNDPNRAYDRNHAGNHGHGNSDHARNDRERGDSDGHHGTIHNH